MGLSQNGAGWYIPTPSGSWQNGYNTGAPSTSTTMVIFVSSSTGKDSGDVGYNSAIQGSSSQPYRTLAAGWAKLRSGSPDWLLLAKGDTWTDETFNTGYNPLNKSGLNATERMIVASYDTTASNNPPIPNPGTGGLARPLLKSPYKLVNDSFIQFSGSGNYIAFMGIDFYAHTRDPDSANFSTQLRSITVASGGSGYAVNDSITLQATDGVTVTNPTVRVSSVSAGVLTAVTIATNSSYDPGAFTTNPSGFTQLSTSGSGSGATFSSPSIKTQMITGFTVTGGPDYFLIEDCRIRFFGSNTNLNGLTAAVTGTNLEVRRNIIDHSWHENDTNVGIGAASWYPATIEQNFIDANGWNITKAPSGNPLNHNFYMNADVDGGGVASGDFTSDLTLSENIIAGDLHDTQMRCGGHLINNFEVACGKAWNYGLSYAAATNIIENNVFTEIGKVWKSGVLTSVTSASTEFASSGPDTHGSYWNWGTGICRGNICTQTGPSPSWHFSTSSGGSLTDVLWTFRNNISWKAGTSIVTSGSGGVFGGTSSGYNIATSTNSYSWPDPDRTIGGYYDQAFGTSGSTSLDFINACYNQSKDNWDTRLTADAVNTYFRAGFGITDHVWASIEIHGGTFRDA